MKKHLLLLETISYAGAIFAFFCFRYFLLDLWWPDFHSDFGLVGLMAQHTLEGKFPIYYYGQNYMGGMEWLTAAILAHLSGKDSVFLHTLRLNSLLWWFSVLLVWAWALRKEGKIVSHTFAWLYAFASMILLQASVQQELAAQSLFFGGALYFLLRSFKNLRSWRGLLFGFVLGLGWWTNQSLIFFLLPALIFYQAIPHAWHRSSFVKEILKEEKGLWIFYSFALALISVGVLISIFGGINFSRGAFHLKMPNGISLSRDVFLVVFFLHLAVKFFRHRKPLVLKEQLPFLVGFLLGFSPVWLGRLFGLYEKSYGVGLGLLPYWQWLGQLKGIFHAIGEVLGSGNMLFLLPTFLAMVFALRYRSRAFLYFLAVAAMNLAYVCFSERSLGVPIRYLYPVFVSSAALVGLLIQELPRLWMRGALGFFVIGLGLSHALYSKDLLHHRAEEFLWRRDNISSLMAKLTSQKHKFCWGDYWTSYLVTYLSHEMLIVSPHKDAPAAQVRYRPYEELVAAQNPKCYLYRKSNEPNAAIFFSEANPWGKK